MTALIVLSLGGGVGVGLLILVRALFQRRVPTLSAIHTTTRGRGVPVSLAGEETIKPSSDVSGLAGHMGRLGVAIIGAIGIADTEKLSGQLRVLDRSIERHAYEKLLASVAGFSLPVLMAVMLAAGGVGVPVPWLLALSVGLAVGGFFYPDLPLSEQVEDRRRAFRHALSAYLDLVTILMAGGAGTESALVSAAEDGEGWAFEEIRRALRRADLTRTSPWEELDDLGEELGIRELRDLATSVAVAGEYGARVRHSLSAKADAMRAGQAAELEAAAERQTERMMLPLIVLAFGVTLFVGYAAIQSISTDTSDRFVTTSTTMESDR